VLSERDFAQHLRLHPAGCRLQSPAVTVPVQKRQHFLQIRVDPDNWRRPLTV
jgi:hypothetical protein